MENTLAHVAGGGSQLFPQNRSELILGILDSTSSSKGMHVLVAELFAPVSSLAGLYFLLLCLSTYLIVFPLPSLSLRSSYLLCNQFPKLISTPLSFFDLSILYSLGLAHRYSRVKIVIKKKSSSRNQLGMATLHRRILLMF